MVPPGASFEFFEGPVFAARTKDLPELVEAIYGETRARFDRFEVLKGEFRLGQVKLQGVLYGFVVRRQARARMSLLWVWNKAAEPWTHAQILAKLEQGRRS